MKRTPPPWPGRLRSTTLVLAWLFLAWPLLAAPDVELDISPLPAEVGLEMTIDVTLRGAESSDCDLIETPTVEGASLRRVSGPNVRSDFSIINGRQSQRVAVTWRFQFIPRTPGVLSIPPFRFNKRGDEEFASEPRTIVVGDLSGVLGEGVVTLDVTPARDEVWLGESVLFTVEAGIRRDVHDMLAPKDALLLELPWLDGRSGLQLERVPVPDCNRGSMRVNGGPLSLPTCLREERRVDGQSWVIYSWEVPLRASQPGTARLDDSRFSIRVVTETRVQRDPFSLFNRGRTEVPTRVSSVEGRAPPVDVRVRATPEQGRPEGYTNAVGRFELRGEAQPRALKVGESCRLVLELSLRDRDAPFSGNLEMVEWPEFDVLADGFRMFGKEEQEFSGARQLVLEVSPKNATVDEVPPLRLPVFDPSTERYEVLEVGPFPLTVEAGGEDGLTTQLSTETELLEELDTVRERLPEPRDEALPPWAPPALGALLLALVELRRRLQGWRRANPASVARARARRTLQKELADAEAVRAVAAAFSRYLAARLGGPAGGLTAEEACERLDDDELAADLRSTVSGWEVAYLGGGGLPVTQAREEAAALADRLEAAA